MNKNLELLSYGERFIITKNNENEYEIESKITSLGAIINEKNEIKYYVTGCYNSGSDWKSIDIKEFMNLKEFCELMIK